MKIERCAATDEVVVAEHAMPHGEDVAVRTAMATASAIAKTLSLPLPATDRTVPKSSTALPMQDRFIEAPAGGTGLGFESIRWYAMRWAPRPRRAILIRTHTSPPPAGVPHPVLRLYLDQKDWITVAKVRAQKPDAHHLRDVVASLVKLAVSRSISTPLSESHVYETWTIGPVRQREDLAWAMMLLSRRDAIAPLRALWEQEADSLFRDRFSGTRDSQIRPFGVGVTFAMFGTEHEYPAEATESDKALTEILVMSEPHRSSLEAEQAEWLERWVRWTDLQTEAAHHLADDRRGLDPRDRAAAMTLQMLGDGLFQRALVNDVHEEVLEALRADGPWALVQGIPTLATLAELLRIRHANVATPWKRSDFHDLRFLSVALTYCDRVSCDNAWADLARRSPFISGRGVQIVSGESSLEALLQGL